MKVLALAKMIVEGEVYDNRSVLAVEMSLATYERTIVTYGYELMRDHDGVFASDWYFGLRHWVKDVDYATHDQQLEILIPVFGFEDAICTAKKIKPYLDQLPTMGIRAPVRIFPASRLLKYEEAAPATIQRMDKRNRGRR